MATIKVVAKGPKWTPETPEAAAKRHKYVKAVGGGELLLSGAPARWAKPEFARDVYSPDLRLVGTPEEITALLRGLGVPDGQIQGWLANAFTAQNYQATKKAQYDAEIAAYTAYKRAKAAQQTGPKVSLNQLNAIYEAVKGGTATTATTTARAPTAKGRGGRTTDLAQRLRDLVAGKVIDCTNMKENGTGCKAIPVPGAGSKKKMVPGLNLVSANYENYKRAIDLLGPEYAEYAVRYQQQLTQPLTALRTPGMVMAAPMTVSPVGSPLATQVGSPGFVVPIGQPQLVVPTLGGSPGGSPRSPVGMGALAGLPQVQTLGSP